MVVGAILTVVLGELTRTLVTVARLDPINRESARAKDEALSVFETMRSFEFDELVVRYNADVADDPVTDISPGLEFDVGNLEAQDTDIDGRVGRVTLPLIGTELREDYVDADMGMPRDLNGDGAIDALDHAGDYMILPVRVDVQWKGKGGDRQFTLQSLVTASR